MRNRHLYRKFHIILETQKISDGKWCCRAIVDRAVVDGRERKSHCEIGDTKNAAMKKALDKTKKTIDRLTRVCKGLRVELVD
jgi:hypothetical protein